MSLLRALPLINGLQKDYKEVYRVFVEIVNELQAIEHITIINRSLEDTTYPYKDFGWIRDDLRKTIYTYNLEDKVIIGDPQGQLGNGKLQIAERTNSDAATEVLTVKRTRADTTPPNTTGFGGHISYRLQGRLVNSEPEAGRIQCAWELPQTDDTTRRDSEVSIWTMSNNVLSKAFWISSLGGVVAPLYPANRVLFTTTGGAFTTSAELQYDSVTDTMLVVSNQAGVTNPNIHLRQDSTGDAYVRVSLNAGRSYAFGIDNSDSDALKISTNTAADASLGTNDIITFNVTGQVGIPNTSASFKLNIDKGAGSEATILNLSRNDTSTTPAIDIQQLSSGDVHVRMSLSGSDSYAIGIDNSDANKLKISYGATADAALGTNDRFTMDVSGRIVIQGNAFTAGRLVQLNHFEEGSWIWCDSSFINPAITLNNTGAGGQQYQIISTRTGGTGAAGSFVVRDNTGAQNRLIIAPNGNFVIGHLVALATTATNGFPYIPTCPGTPTGVPTAFAGHSAVVYDDTNFILYVYAGGAWRAH